MSENNFEEILNFIVDSFPQYKNNKLNINQIINLLHLFTFQTPKYVIIKT